MLAFLILFLSWLDTTVVTQGPLVHYENRSDVGLLEQRA